MCDTGSGVDSRGEEDKSDGPLACDGEGAFERSKAAGDLPPYKSSPRELETKGYE